MSARHPVHGWRQGLRIGALVFVGALGLAARWSPIPRWGVLLAAAVVPVVWVATGLQTARVGETESDRRRRTRNVAIALALFVLVALFYAATMVRLGGNVMNRPI